MCVCQCLQSAFLACAMCVCVCVWVCRYLWLLLWPIVCIYICYCTRLCVCVCMRACACVRVCVRSNCWWKRRSCWLAGLEWADRTEGPPCSTPSHLEPRSAGVTPKPTSSIHPSASSSGSTGVETTTSLSPGLSVWTVIVGGRSASPLIGCRLESGNTILPPNVYALVQMKRIR